MAKRRKAPEPEQVNAIEDLVAWDEPVDGKVLADTIHGEISAHVIMSKECATAITLWIMLSYTYEAFIIFPLLSILSPQRRCGKTHLMTMLRAFCYRGLMSSNISNAGIFRIAHAKKPTLLLDELDTYYKDNEHLRGILNSGHNYYSAILVAVVASRHRERISLV